MTERDFTYDDDFDLDEDLEAGEDDDQGPEQREPALLPDPLEHPF